MGRRTEGHEQDDPPARGKGEMRRPDIRSLKFDQLSDELKARCAETIIILSPSTSGFSNEELLEEINRRGGTVLFESDNIPEWAMNWTKDNRGLLVEEGPE